VIGGYPLSIDAGLDEPAAALERFRPVLADMLDRSSFGLAGETLRRVGCCLGRPGRYDPRSPIATADQHRLHTGAVPLRSELRALVAAATDRLTPVAIGAARRCGRDWSIPQALRACLDEIDRLPAG